MTHIDTFLSFPVEFPAAIYGVVIAFCLGADFL